MRWRSFARVAERIESSIRTAGSASPPTRGCAAIATLPFKAKVDAALGACPGPFLPTPPYDKIRPCCAAALKLLSLGQRKGYYPMSNRTTAGVRLDFANLPLVEVAVRAAFSQRVELKFAIINRVAESLRSEFPILVEPDRLELPPGISGPVEFGSGTLAGASYSGNQHGIIITVQSQLIVARWLKQIQPSPPPYPRYSALRDALWQAFDALTDAINGARPPIAVTNMSYVNFLTMSPSEPVLAKYFSELVHVRAAVNSQALYKLEASWREQDEVDLRFTLEQVAARMEERDVEGFRLATAAGQRLAASANPQENLDSLHDRLQIFFRDVLSERAKTEWALTSPETT